ncbi:HpcH/HpaI aldolase family protein [Falsiroseomonas selenitidurans]|uniref:Aldolase n=1 Tax=Falsiroseomonas selenitidurans TaxID=2716335 RepID=A0ABX1E648_9PROT|nr:aldolase/citrate lyase family protein [Falsiroseomonas selenitidurans]NKC31242.1 aldolase [Falsiroseomonas selenitidurans]
MASPSPADSFRTRLQRGDLLVGSFIKTPTLHATEILGGIGFDFVVVDEEHSPFDRQATDAALFAARATGAAGLVRVPTAAAHHILSVLDCGATGVLVPHVASAALAAQVAAAARYRGGRRGYSGSVRAAGYGGGRMADYIAAADAATTVVAQIEDPEALEEIDAIAATPGIDALFIGRGDLTAALAAPSNDSPPIRDAVARIAAAARRAGKPVMVFVGGMAEATWLREVGATAFVHSSDQGFMKQAAARALAEMRALGQPGA